VPKLFGNKNNNSETQKIKIPKEALVKKSVDKPVSDSVNTTKPVVKSRKIRKPPNRKRQIIYGSLIVVGAFLAAAALRMLIGDVVEDAAARNEYEQLRAHSPTGSLDRVPGNDYIDDFPEPDEYYDPEAAEEENINFRALSFDELAAINRDFVGWIGIGSFIDYPVVRGSDNNKYINTTFTGNRNSAGTIFMDYRNTRNFDEHITILYGHLTRDGTMFSSLSNYLNSTFLQNNPNISITTRDGVSLTYRVFAAKQTDAWDPAYSVGFTEGTQAADVFPNVPANASSFLLLSTCTRSRNDDERIIVFAART